MDGRSGPPITGDARGGTLADTTNRTMTASLTGQQQALGGHIFPSGYMQMTDPSRRPTQRDPTAVSRGRQPDGTRAKTYQNPIRNMIPNDGARVRGRLALIGETTAGAAWTANGCDLRKAPAHPSPPTPINDAT